MTHVVAIWLNYNSSEIFDVVRESLRSVLNLERGDFDLTILVTDGGSTDNSPDMIEKEIKNSSSQNNVVFLRLPENRGYAGNMNGGYKYAVENLGADYVAFLNNDFIVERDSLRRLYEWMRREEYTGVQGIELSPSGAMGNAGMFHDEFGQVISICGGYKLGDCQLDKPRLITFAIGSYMLYSVDYIRELPNKLPFITETFAGFDDNYLGLMAWQRQRKVAFVPVIEGTHYGNLTTRSVHKARARSVSAYLGTKNRVALWENMRCRYHSLLKLYTARLYGQAKLGLLDESIRRGISDGIKLAKLINETAGVIDLEKAVHVEYSRAYYLARALIPGLTSMRPRDTHIKYLEKYIRYPDWLRR